MEMICMNCLNNEAFTSETKVTKVAMLNAAGQEVSAEYENNLDVFSKITCAECDSEDIRSAHVVCKELYVDLVVSLDSKFFIDIEYKEDFVEFVTNETTYIPGNSAVDIRTAFEMLGNKKVIVAAYVNDEGYHIIQFIYNKMELVDLLPYPGGNSSLALSLHPIGALKEIQGLRKHYDL